MLIYSKHNHTVAKLIYSTAITMQSQKSYYFIYLQLI